MTATSTGPPIARSSASSAIASTDMRREWVLELVDVELGRALVKFGAMRSPHEGHSVIREEFEELWKHVMEDTGRTNAARAEAVQLAAMACRYVLDLCEVPGD